MAKDRYSRRGSAYARVFGGGVASGGSYSKADVAKLVAHAAEINIDIMPAVEVPAHALALNRVIDGLRDPKDTGQEASVQGICETR